MNRPWSSRQGAAEALVAAIRAASAKAIRIMVFPRVVTSLCRQTV
jgi:hypothetical protein